MTIYIKQGKIYTMLKKLTFAIVALALVVSSMGAAVMPATAEVISDGDLIKTADSTAVYYVQGDGVSIIPNQEILFSWLGTNDWDDIDVIEVEQSVIDSYATLMPMWFNGRFFKATGAYIEGFEESSVFYQHPATGAIHPVVSGEAFQYLTGTEAWGDVNEGAYWDLVEDAGYINSIPEVYLQEFTDFPVGATLTTDSDLPQGLLVEIDDEIHIIDENGDALLLTDEVAEEANISLEGSYTAPVVLGDDLTSAGTATIDDVVTLGGVTFDEIVEENDGNVAFSVSSNTPASGYVSKGAQNAIFAKFDVEVEDGTAEIDEITIKREGLSYDSDVAVIRLFDGATQLGSDQSLNTTTHKATFKNLNWEVSGTETLTVKANVAAGASGTNLYFSLTDAEAAGSVSGLPISGNPMEFSALTVGDFYVNAATGTSGSATVISGATDQELGCFTFESATNGTNAENFDVHSINITNTGSASDGDLSNFVLKQGSLEIGTASSMEGGEIMIDMSDDPYELKASTNKRLCLYGDISEGITVSKNFKATISEATDVVAVGQDSSAQALLETASDTTFTSQTDKTVTIGQGTATIATNSAYDVTAGKIIVKGAENVKMGAFKVTAGADEGVKLTKVRFTLAGSNVVGTDFSNWMLYKIVDGEEVEIPVSGSVSSTNITFEDTSDGLIDVAKTENETIVVRADVSGSVDGDEAPYIYINADGTTTNTEARIMGLESEEYITNGVTVSGDAYSTGDRDGLALNVNASGTLTITKASSSPDAVTFSKGEDDVELLDINFYATGEPMTVTTLYVDLWQDTSAAAYTSHVDTGDVSNVRLIDEDGETVGSACSSPSSGVCTFSFDETIPEEENTVWTVVADTGTAVTYAYASVYDDTTTSDRVDTSGYYSMATITETISNISGNLMTAGTPTITAAMSTSPVAAHYVTGTSEVTLGRLVLSASTAESVKVTSIKVSADDADTLAGDGASASTKFDTIKLVDDSDPTIQYGTTQNFTDASPDYANFTGISDLTVADGESKIIRIVGDVTGTSTEYFFGVASSSDITAVGATSSADATISGVTSAIASTGITCESSGSLKVNKAADMPVAAQLVSGSTGVSVMKYKLQGTYEDVKITSLPIYYDGTVSNIGPFKLYLNGEQVGNEDGYEFTSNLKTIDLESDPIIIDKNTPDYLTIKVDVRSSSQVTTSTSSTYFGIADADGDDAGWATPAGAGEASNTYSIVAKGDSSGTTIVATTIDSLGTGDGEAYGSNAFTLHKGILTATLNASTPDGYRTAGSNEELIRFDLTATGDEITVNEMEFCVTGNAEISGTGTVYLKNAAGTLTYGSITDAEFETYWDDAGDGANGGTVIDPILDTVRGTTSEATCFSWGDTAAADDTAGGLDIKAFTVAPTIAEGDTLTLKVTGDTTGAATNKTLKVSINPNPASTCGGGAATCAATTSGIEWQDSSGTDIDLTTTEGLPLYGETLLY